MTEGTTADAEKLQSNNSTYILSNSFPSVHGKEYKDRRTELGKYQKEILKIFQAAEMEFRKRYPEFRSEFNKDKFRFRFTFNEHDWFKNISCNVCLTNEI